MFRAPRDDKAKYTATVTLMALSFAKNPLRTRADVAQLVRDLVTPIVPHFSAGCAQVRLGENRAHYGDPAGWLEGFARPLWGLAPLAAGGENFDHWSLWQRGLAAGSDPAHGEYWGRTGDYDQRSVEQAAFGLGLAIAPQQLWDPLAPAVRARLADWLRQINDVRLVQSNWLFFRVLVNLGLQRCGQAFSPEQISADLTQIDRFHLGNGWYTDGAGGPPWRDGRTGDYYVPMGFQFYGLLCARLGTDPMRTAKYIERARQFAEDFQYYFSADGAALPFGRSLTYRFAQGAFWGALAFADVEALPWGVIKGLYLRHLRGWMRQPVFSETGLLTIGYAYPNLTMAESYNSPGSPYWALKAFIPLAVPDTHPFWSAEEMPLPQRRRVHTVPGAKLIFATDPRTRDVTALNPGQPVLDWPRHAPQKYSKCAYGTRLGCAIPTGPATPTEGGLDSTISLSDDGRFFHVREQCLDSEVRDGVAFSRWQPWSDVELRTWIIADATSHLRVHHLKTARHIWSVDSGFAVGFTDKTTRQLCPDDPLVPVVRTPNGSSAIRNLIGRRTPDCVDLGANGHLLTSLSAMPLLRGEHTAGEYWFVSWVGGSAETNETFAATSEFSAEVAGATCYLRLHGDVWWNSTGGPCGWSSAERLERLESPA